MKLPVHLERRPGKWESTLFAGGLAFATLLAWLSPLGLWTELFSFDLISVARRVDPPTDTVLILLDERSHEVLGQPYDRPWDRRLHGHLVDRLRETGARLVYFDIVFGKSGSEDGAADAAFAEAIRRHGMVVLGGSIAPAQEAESVQRRVIAPEPRLRKAARAWGSLSFVPIDGDYGVRKVPIQLGEVEHAAQHAARLLKGTATNPETVTAPQSLQYFGPPGTFSSVSYHQALDPEGVPPGTFKDKVVLIGVKYSTGFSGSGKDTFATPYSRFGAEAMLGTEVNANLLSTLRFDLSLRRLSPLIEISVLIAGAAALVWFLLGLGPSLAGFVTLGSMIAVSASAWLASTGPQVWGNWFLLVGGVAPAAFIASVGRNYYIERARREKITRAFEKYLSPEMVRQMSMSSIDLKPGGTTRRVTAMMTDIEGFSSLAEKMSAEEVSRMLIAYFSELTRHVFDHQGTVIQFVGDAIYCVWGAPLDEPEQADRAVRAALAIQTSMYGKLFERHALKTRIGISTGYGLCGNLGSSDRFDYAVIGDNTNLAARIESTNKKLGTRILLSDSAKLALRGDWIMREVGDFVVAGRVQSVRLWEPLVEGSSVPAAWADALPRFSEALAAWRQGRWAEAEELFRSTDALRGPEGDGPSRFYLRALHDDHVRARPGPIRL